MAGLHFDITGDNANFLRKLDEARNGVRSTSKQIEESGVSIEQMFGRLAKGAAAFGAGITAKEIVSNIVRVRGEFQQLEVAFKTMLGSEEQANTLMGQLVNTAAKTPFDLQGVANGAKQLLAYGTSAEDVNGTLVRLGDIAAGLSIPLGDLVYLYGTTMTQGRLFTQDLRQFQGRGIPLADELAKQFGVAKDKVGELVTAGKVGFPEVQKAIEAMTNDGGKFGGLMEAQSKTITGQISNIEDSIATMYNNIGKQSEGFINDALSGVSYLVENYEEIGKTVLELAAVYGAYKAVLMSVAAYQSFATGITYSAEIAELSKLIPLKKQSANEDVIAAVASGKLTQAKAEQVMALRTEISAKIQSLQATEAQTKAEYSSAMASYKSATQRMLIAKQNMAIAQSQMQIAIKSGTVDEIAAAKKNAQTASLELNNAAVAKNTAHKSLNIASTNKKTATDALSSMHTGVNTAVQNANTASTNILTVAKTRLAAASRALGLSMLANPYVLTTAAIVGLGYGIYKLTTYQADAEKAQSKLNDTVKEFNSQTATENAEIDRLFDKLRNTSRETSSYQKTKDEIIKKYGNYLDGLNQEISTLNDVEAAYRAISSAARQAAADRAISKATQEAQDDWAENRGNVIDKLKGALTSSGKMSNGAAEAFIETINRELKETGRLSDETAKKIEKYNYTITHPETGEVIGSGNSVSWAIDALKKNDKILDDLYDQINSKFGVNTNEYENLGKDDINAYIKGFEGVLSNFKKTGNKQTVQLKTGWVSFESEEELELQLKKLKDVRDSFDNNNSTEAEKKAASEWLSSYKKTYEDADKAYNDFLKSKQIMSDADRDRELKRLKEERDIAKSTYEGKGGSVSSNSKQDNQTEKLRKEQEAYQNDRLKSIKDAKEAELDLERSAIEDKIKLIEFERDARIKAIQEEKEAYKKKHGNNADTSGFDRQIAVVEQQAKTDIGEQIQEDAKARLIAMQEYLKEYGTFQQKKYAVAEEYARKIKEAQTEGERLSLEKELASYNSNIQAGDLKMNIDWGTVFGEFGGMFSEMIKPALEDAKKYLTTDQFKNSDEASKQALIEAIAQMEKSLGGAGTLDFKQLGVDIQFYQNTLIALNEAKQVEIESIEKLKEAQEKYNEALKNGSQTEIDTAKTNLENAQDNATAASENVQAQINIANQAQQTVTDTAAALKASMDNVTQGLSKIASGSLTGAYEGLLQVSKGVGGVMEKLADKLESVPIIGWIVSIIDIFKDGLSLLVGGLLDAIFNAVSGIISDVLSGDLFVTIGESISKGVVSIIKSIVTLGGLFSFMDDESDPDLQADIDRLTASNERLEEALNKLADKMNDAATSEATSVYKEQLDNVTNREKNAQEMMQREAAAWARFGYGFAGLGGKGSSNSKINDNISGSEWSEISKVVGRNISNAGDFWGLSSEEMAKVADEAGWIYDKIKGYADDGHKDAAKYMDDYISYAKEREELEKAYYEKLTNTSFDSVRDEFKNALLNMESDAEDFTNNFEKMMQNAIIESMMTEKYDKKLKEWYRSFGDAMEDGEMTQGEKDTLQNDYNNMVNDALKERDMLKDVLGLSSSSSSQSSTQKGFQAMSQDTGEELNGRFTAFQISNEEIKNSMLSMLASVSLLSVSVNSNGITLVEIRNLMISSNSYLEDIAKYTKLLIDCKKELESIKNNTKSL